MGKRGLQALLILLLGADLDVPHPSGDGWGVTFTGPAMAVAVYAILVCVVWFRIANHLPGIFALRSPLGRVRSGYEALWFPAVFATVCAFEYRTRLDGAVFNPDPAAQPEPRYLTLRYGAAVDSLAPVVALGVFMVLMLSLKLHACMVEANRRVGSTERSTDRRRPRTMPP